MPIDLLASGSVGDVRSDSTEAARVAAARLTTTFNFDTESDGAARSGRRRLSGALGRSLRAYLLLTGAILAIWLIVWAVGWLLDRPVVLRLLWGSQLPAA